MFFLKFCCFLYNPTNVDHFFSRSSACSKSILYIWKFLVHELLKPSMKDFEHNLTRIWNKCNSICVWVCAKLLQLCLTLCDPIDSSPLASSVRRYSPGKNTGVGCHALLQGIFPSQGSNPGLPHCRQILYRLSHQGSPVRDPVCLPSVYLQKLKSPLKSWFLKNFQYEAASGVPLSVMK